MRIQFISMDSINKRGGNLYERGALEKLRNRFGDEELRVIDNTEELIGKPSRLFPGKETPRYISGYRKHAEDLLACDYLGINMSTHMYFSRFPWHLKKKSGCRIVAITHHLDYLGYTGLQRAIREYFTKNLMKHTDCILTPNPYTMDLLKDMGFENKTRLLEVYLDKTIPKTMQSREKIVLTVGGVEQRKGLEYGIEAFAKFSQSHPDYRYIIAGQVNGDKAMTAYYEQLTAQIKTLDVEDKITFTGNISDEERNTLYQKAGMFLFPSQLEGYGWVMIEAMRYGSPVIAFDVSAMPRTVNASNGMLIPNKDADAMSRAMASLADDPKLYAQLSAGARDTVRALPDREMIDRETQAFLDDLAAKRI